jgi:SnoaL-like protein
VNPSVVEPLIEAYYAGFNERRLEATEALLAPEAVVERMWTGGGRRGAAAYRAFADVWLQAFPDARLTIDRITRMRETLYDVELRAHTLLGRPWRLFGGWQSDHS